jgi:hypothetical protein
MAHRTVVVDSLAYAFASDDPSALAERVWSLIQGRAIDEITGAPLQAIEVTTAEPELGTKVGDGGTYAVYARPWHRFPPLAASGYAVHVTVAAEGYLPSTQVVNVPTHQRTIVAPAPVVGSNVVTLSSSAGLAAGQRLLVGPATNRENCTIANIGPGANQVTLAAPLAHGPSAGDPVVADEFAPVVVADLPMRRRAVTIRGRTVRRNASGIGNTPVANAAIVAQGLWRSARDVAQHLPPTKPVNVASLSPGLYAARPAGATLAAQGLPVIAGDDKLLLEPAAAGDSSLATSNRLNLVAPPAPPPHSVLRIDVDNPELAEHIGINAVSALGTAGEPGRVGLEHALRVLHRRGVRTQRVAPQPPAPPNTLTDAGMPGDACVFLNNLVGLGGAATVGIAGGVAPREYQRVRTLDTVSDADGYFELPPVSRIAQLHLVASAPTLAATTLDVQPDYTQREHWIDVVFP